MDVLAGSLFNILVSSSLSTPRIWWNKEARTYEQAREQRLSKLPKDHSIHRLRGKLSSVDLEEIEGRERKLHETYEKHLHTNAREAIRSASFFEGEDALPPREQDIVGDLNSFSLPGQLYAGPRYSGGRFFKEGEKLTAKDLAVLPTSDWDLYSRSHDIRFSLISAIPDAEKRAELRNAANGIYHYQIYLSDDLPKEVGEISQHKFTTEILPVLMSAYGLANLVNSTAERVAMDVANNIDDTLAGQYNHYANLATRPNRDYHLRTPDDFFSRPIDTQPLLHSSIPRADGTDVNIPWGESYTRGPLYSTYLNTIRDRTDNTSAVFNDPDVQRLLRLPEFDDLLRDMGRSDALPPSLGRDVLLDRYGQRIDDLIHRLDHGPGLTIGPNGTARNRIEVHNNPLPTAQQIALRRSVVDILTDKTFWGKLGAGFAIDRFFRWTAQRGYSKYAESNPEMLVEIEKTVYPYERAHPFYKRLGEFLFRQGFSNEIGYDPTLTRKDIDLYLDSLDHVAGDPVVDEIRKLYPFLPDHPVSEPEKVSGVEPVEEKETVTRPEIPTKADTSVDTSVDTPVDHVELSRGHTEDVLSFLLDSDEKIESLTLEEIAEILQLLS